MEKLISDLQRLLRDVPFGHIYLDISTHEGKPRSVYATYTRSEAKTHDTEDALDRIRGILAQAKFEKKNGGAIVLTLVPKDGEISQIVSQSNDRMSFRYDDATQ